MRDSNHLGQLVLALGGSIALSVASCAGTTVTPSSGAPGGDVAAAAPMPNEAGARGANLGGARCQGAVCTCRSRAGDPAEKSPPAEGHKRFEIRIGAGGGAATLTSPTLGDFASGSGEACFY